MTINDNKVVHLSYQLEVDGKIEDQSTPERPLEFIFGQGYLLPKFEANIKDLKVGDKFDFRLSAKEGYGETNPAMIGDLPIEIFMQDGEFMKDIVYVGNIIPMMNQQGGVVPGKVLEVGEKTVKMDFNHPMAGKDLHFTGEIVLVREATEEELTNGLHGERSGCQGNCGGCSCDEGCECEGDCENK